ncbi:MAG: metallophosphoesterase family protein [Thermoanaerobacteraceae bacterium]|nr:metallophosphoesterase family protein [Thermoanaerobacteraceae bacterium]
MIQKIGIISDTHGLVRTEVINILKRCDLIIHAGDMGKPEIICTLKEIAPVVAVRGNVDKGDWAEKLPETEVVELSKIYIYVIHDIKKLDLNPKTAGFNIVIYGHSHKPKKEIVDGILYLNPGSAGPKRFNLPISMALMEISNDINVSFINLE